MSITDNVFVIKPLSLRYKLALLCLYLGFHKTHFSFASQIPARVSQKGGCMCLCAHSLGQVGCFAAPWTYRGGLQAKILEWVAVSHPRVPSQPRNEPRCSALQVDSLPKGQEIWKGERKHIFVFPIPVTMKCNGSSL